MHKENRFSIKKAVAIFLCIVTVISVCLVYYFREPVIDRTYKDFSAPTPIVSSVWSTNVESNDANGDIYVSKSGADTNDGTKEKPFFSIERALEAVAAMDRTDRSEITVCIEAGEYHIEPLFFSEQHGGGAECKVTYTGYGGKAVLNLGTTLEASDFKKADEYPEIYGRLQQQAREKVLVLDLKNAPYNLTEKDLGKLYPIGTYNTADRYQGDTTGGIYSELFINGKRQNLARYPNSGYIYTGKVISPGSALENKANGDPAGDVFSVSDELSSRIQSWSNKESVWMYGFWKHDWADGSTPLEAFDAETNSLTAKYQSFFGIRENAPYFFYNCLEELDCDNEWFLDRESGLLCVYSSSGLAGSNIYMSLSEGNVITLNASNVTLKNLTVEGTRGNGIIINGNGNVITDCTVRNIGRHAIQVFGYDNVITKNELYSIGMGGISVNGGDRTTLTPGNNVVSNNMIHDWSEIFKTYQAGIDLEGVGNICSNNELFNAPHLAITYGGNNHIFEYNLIYNVCLESDDAGAIYAGKSWSSYGNEIKHNLIYNIGSNGKSPNGIYMDDAFSGQSILGNILINIPGYAIFVGGGRDMIVQDNLVINAGEAAIRHDIRAREALLNDTWFSGEVDYESGALWKTLYLSPWQSEIWQEAFPQYKTITTDPEKINDPCFMANPANSSITGNIVFDKYGSIGKIDGTVYEYSNVSDNELHYLSSLGAYFDDYNEGIYLSDKDNLKEFNKVLDKVGRY